MTLLPWGETADEALTSWAADDEICVRFAVWLAAEATAEDWHRVALGWNWDRGSDPLWWMIVHPACDKATALTVFWGARPDYYLKFAGDRDAVPSVNADGFDLAREVRTRWMDGFYTRSEFAFALEEDGWGVDFAALEARAGARLAVDIPPGMRGPLAGRKLDTSGFIEGIPARFWPEGLR